MASVDTVSTHLLGFDLLVFGKGLVQDGLLERPSDSPDAVVRLGGGQTAQCLHVPGGQVIQINETSHAQHQQKRHDIHLCHILTLLNDCTEGFNKPRETKSRREEQDALRSSYLRPTWRWPAARA